MDEHRSERLLGHIVHPNNKISLNGRSPSLQLLHADSITDNGGTGRKQGNGRGLHQKHAAKPCRVALTYNARRRNAVDKTGGQVIARELWTGLRTSTRTPRFSIYQNGCPHLALGEAGRSPAGHRPVRACTDANTNILRHSSTKGGEGRGGGQGKEVTQEHHLLSTLSTSSISSPQRALRSPSIVNA